MHRSTAGLKVAGIDGIPGSIEDSKLAVELEAIRETFSSELILLRCKDSFQRLDHCNDIFISSICDRDDPQSRLQFISYNMQLITLLKDPQQMIRRAFELVMENAWNAQLWSLRSMGETVVSTIDIVHQPITLGIVAYLQKVGLAISLLSHHLESQLKSALATDASSNLDAKPQPMNVVAPPMNCLETIRHSCIGKMLADVEPLSRTAESSASGFSYSSTSAHWDQLDGSSIKPTPAEMRWREDAYLGFCIAALIGCTPSIEADSPGDLPAVTSKFYLTQLYNVVQGKVTRSQRRLTTRSRLRAAAALNLANHSPEYQRDLECRDIRSTLQVLYCFAQLQETRIPCSEETLVEALRGPQSSAIESRRIDPYLLVRTWLHDVSTKYFHSLVRDIVTYACFNLLFCRRDTIVTLSSYHETFCCVLE